MPEQGITFNGSFLPLPGAYYADNVTAVAPTAPPNTPPLIFLGYGWGQQPQTAQTFTNPQDLLNALRGGPAAAFVPFLALPSPTMAGAQRITFIDVSENTQSTLSLLTSGATSYGLLTSALYGPPSNLLQAQVQAGTSGGVKLTLIDNYAKSSIVGDNLGIPFSVTYTGAATGNAGITVAASAVVLTGPSGSSGQNFTLSTASGGYTTVSQLVAAINGTGYYRALLQSFTNGALPASGLTSGSYTATSGGVYAYIAAYKNDPLYWINNFASAYATAVSGAANVDTVASLPASAAATYFSGAVGGPPVTNDYASGFNLALLYPGWTIFADSNAAAVQALGNQHAQTASSTPYGMWRRFFTGSSLGDSVATTLANAAAMNAISTNYLYPGIVQTSAQTGLRTTYSGLYVAAMAAAMATGNQIPQPLTNKPLNGTGVEVAISASNLSLLQNNGVMAVFSSRLTNNVPTILSDMTTWQVDANVANTSSQQVACRYWLAYSVINTLQQFVGTIAAPVTEVNILKAVISTLNALIFTGGSSNGVLASWNRASLTLVYTGINQLAAVTFQATLVGQNRYITCYVPVQPLNITVSAAAIPAA